MPSVLQSNELRRSRCLRLIKPDWFLYRVEFGSEDWKVSKSARNLCKRVQYDPKTRATQWEEDYYYSGRTYSDVDGTGWEHVVIHYEYRSGIYHLYYLGTNSSLATVAESLNLGTTNGQVMSRIADDLLQAMGLTRL